LGLQIGRVLVGLMTGSFALRSEESYDPNDAPGVDFLYKSLEGSALVDGPPSKGKADEFFKWYWTEATAEFGGLAALAKPPKSRAGPVPDAELTAE
jgi:hypothetical protein